MADSQLVELPANTASALPVTPINATYTPPQDTPVVHKAAVQEHSMDPAVSDDAYKLIGGETKGHYLVGMKPEDFLDEFIPWNPRTPDSYKQQVPDQTRKLSLQSVPPQAGQNETHMYAPFVKALDEWVTGTDNGQKLRFGRFSKPDTSCASMNPDVSTYWEQDFPGTEGACQFSHHQTHEEFKSNHNHDAFKHKFDEGPKAEAIPDEAGETPEGIQIKVEELDEGGPSLTAEVEATHDEAGETPESIQINAEELEGGPSLISEVEADTLKGIHTRGQIAAYAGVAMSMAFRSHFFSMLILGKYARIIRWDRRGAIVTSRFDYTRRPELIFNFYLRFGQLSLRQRGFDTSVKPLDVDEVLPTVVASAFDNYYLKSWYKGAKYGHKDDAPQTPATEMRFFRIAVEDRTLGRTETFFIPAPIFRHAYLTPFSRASRRSLAFYAHPKEGKMCFLKDSWQEVSARTAPEADIYRKLHAHHVPHIASMRLGGDVAGLETETQKKFHVLSHSGRYRKLGNMVCHRLILDTVARDLSTFTWCKVLLSCLADVVDAAQQAYKIGILHRDISAGNVMIVKDEKTKEWRGVLIDWDMCLLLEQRVRLREIRTARTGTWAFISTRLLMASGDPPVVHSLGDDMESIFWVLTYEVLRYTNHNRKPYKLFQIMKNLFSDVTNDDGLPTGGETKYTTLHTCALGKVAFSVAKFKTPGLPAIIEELSQGFVDRYSVDAAAEDDDEEEGTGEVDNRKEQGPSNPGDEDSASEDSDSSDDDRKKRPTIPSVDLDNPDEQWFSRTLRHAAAKMAPLSVTPTGLVSRLNSKKSKPPSDPSKWESAQPSQQCKADFYEMPWSKDENLSKRAQENHFKSVTSSMFNHMEGIPYNPGSKRSHNDHDDDSEDQAPAKKHRPFS